MAKQHESCKHRILIVEGLMVEQHETCEPRILIVNDKTTRESRVPIDDGTTRIVSPCLCGGSAPKPRALFVCKHPG